MKTDHELGEDCLNIDELNLDTECKQQPHLYFQAAANAAEKRRIADELKNALEVVEVDVQMRIRNKPEKYLPDGKVTEPAVKAAVAVHTKVQEALKEYMKARHAQTMADALVAALDQKKRSLTLMVNLHSTSYFAEVKPSEGGRAAVEGMTRKKTRRPVERHRKEVDREDEDNE